MLLIRISNKITRELKTLYAHFLMKIQTGEVIIKGKIHIRSIPIIQVKDGSIIIHNNVTLNSDNKNYFINMHSPIKLRTSAPGAQIIIGENTRIHGTCIHAYEKITIGKNCLIAANCQIVDTNRHELSFDNPSQRLDVSTKTEPVSIGNDVWIGANCIILPGVSIGDCSVIAAGSIVTKDTVPFSLNGGNPCKEIRRYNIPNQYYPKE